MTIFNKCKGKPIMLKRKNKLWASAAALCAVAGASAAAIIMGGAPHGVPGDGNCAYDLKCEGLERPIAVATLAPRLSWKLPDGWKSQSAYELQVGTDSIAVANGGESDLWGTGRVESQQSVGVEYAGDALTPGIQAYWRVRVWNEAGEPSAWSKVGRFGVGYIDGNEMPGEYIGMSSGSSGNQPQKYLMIPNRVYTGIANHRYNREEYLDGIDYPVEYLGYSTVDKIHWDSDEIDRVEIHLNVKTSPDAIAGKDYRLEILSGDEENSYYQYVGNPVIYSDATFNYSVNSDSRLFENGTFDSNDAGRYTPAGPYKEGDDEIYAADRIKDLGPSIRQRFGGKFSPIRITPAQGSTDEIPADGNAKAEYFNLKGIRVESPRNGIYIRRTGNKIEKVVIR